MTSHTDEGNRIGRAIDPVEALAVLREVPEVRDAVVTENLGTEGRTMLLGYITGPDPAIGTAGIRQHLMARLPDYLIPEHLFVLDELPLTPGGDYDLSALPEPDADSSTVDSYVAPRTPTEQQLADFVKELLGVDRVGIHDSFFGLGGSSFLATRLTTQIRKVFDVELTLREVFESPTVDGLAQLIVRDQNATTLQTRSRRTRERAFWYVAGHPALLRVWRRVRRIRAVRQAED